MSNPDPVARAQRESRRRIGVIAVIGMAFGAVLVALPAGAAKEGFPESFNPETAPGYTNTYSTKGVLSPACPEAIAATPGSDPATKVLNNALNTAASFQPGGTVHFTYLDNPHTNPGTQNFTIQDCVVTYPAGFFAAGDFDATTGVLTNATFDKATLVKGGTQIDGAALSGIRSSVGDIHFSWTSPADLVVDSWVCFFARDIRNNHGGGGNRKVPPTCYRVPAPPSTTTTGTPREPPPPPVTPNVWLGYVDNLHIPAVGFLPDPWRNSPNVVFLGCVAPGPDCGDSYDGGAIRVDNQGTGPMTLVGARVDITSTNGTCGFRTWDGLLADSAVNKTVGPGGTLILTQTGTLGPPQATPCDGRVNALDRAFTNFDTSEGPLDSITANFSNCDPSDAVVAPPVITLVFAGGLTLTIVDNPDPVLQDDEILTTGGVDRFACKGTPWTVEEATPWTAVPAGNISRSV